MRVQRPPILAESYIRYWQSRTNLRDSDAKFCKGAIFDGKKWVVKVLEFNAHAEITI